jgi:hypothetical protein
MKAACVAALVVTIAEPFEAERAQQASMAVTFVAYSSDATVASIEGTGAARIDEIWIGMQDARVRPAAACKAAATRSVIAGNFTVELVQRRGATDASRLDVARYCTFDVQLRRSRGKVGGAPSELRGASIVVRGRRADGTSFVVRSQNERPLVLRATGLEGFAATAPSTSWIVGVDAARWFTGVDLGTAEHTGDTRDRVLRIDEKNNPELLAAFNANVATGFALFDDVNSDRSLDAEEQRKPLATTR